MPIERTKLFHGAEDLPLIARIKELTDKAYGAEAGDDASEQYDKIVAFARKLQSKYPDFRRRKAYHALIGSTVEATQDIDDDFPGEDSVVAFLKGLIKEHENGA